MSEPRGTALGIKIALPGFGYIYGLIIIDIWFAANPKGASLLPGVHQERGMWWMHPHPPAIFNNIFDQYIFHNLEPLR